jgi:hypothetical protein
MKFRNIAAAFVLAAGLGSFAGCNQQPKEEAAKEETTETTTTTKITDKEYICPMKCEGSASDMPGKCVVCDMDLEKNPDYSAPVSASADTSQTGTVTDTTAKK